MRCALVLLAGLLCATSSPAADDAETRARITAAQERIAAVRGNLTQGQTALRDAERAMARSTTELRTVRQRVQAQRRQLAALSAERAALAARAEAQAKTLARDVRDAWLLGRQPPLQRWLAAGDPQQAARIARYYDYLHRDHAERLAQYRATQQSLLLAEEKLRADTEALASTETELEARATALRAARNDRQRAVRKLASELDSEQARLKRLQEDAAALRRLAVTAREAFRDVPPQAVGAPLAQRRGKLRWPVAGRLALAFGAPMAEGKLHANGIVIGAAEGSEVRAVHAGRVAWADWLRGYGLLVILDHGDGFLTIYGYNQALARQAGDWVQEGEVLATVGTSGGQARPGLYFELRRHGQPEDPVRWLRRP